MPRSRRCEFQGAIYLVTLTGYSGGNVFYDPQIFRLFPEKPRSHAPDAEFFETVLWETCEQYGARVHAYILEPNSGLAVIETPGGPLSWIMHDLLARYSAHLHEQDRIPKQRKPFPGRYTAQVVQPAKLPYAVRYVHRRKVTADRRRRAINHPFSSNFIYCCRRPQPECFVVSATRAALERLGYPGLNSYFEFMLAGDTPSIAYMLSRRVIGEGHFADCVLKQSQIPAAVPSPDEILQQVTGTLLHAEPSIACSSTHLGALARALVAWYAMRTGAAQIGATAKWFGVTSSDLRYLIRRHRQKHPKYFSEPLPSLFATLSAHQNMTAQTQQRPYPSAQGGQEGLPQAE